MAGLLALGSSFAASSRASDLSIEKRSDVMLRCRRSQWRGPRWRKSFIVMNAFSNFPFHALTPRPWSARPCTDSVFKTRVTRGGRHVASPCEKVTELGCQAPPSRTRLTGSIGACTPSLVSLERAVVWRPMELACVSGQAALSARDTLRRLASEQAYEEGLAQIETGIAGEIRTMSNLGWVPTTTMSALYSAVAPIVQRNEDELIDEVVHFSTLQLSR